jgi:hypothetical protein
MLLGADVIRQCVTVLMVGGVDPEQKVANVLEACENNNRFVEPNSRCVESNVHLGRVRFNFALVGPRLRSTYGTAAIAPRPT